MFQSDVSDQRRVLQQEQSEDEREVVKCALGTRLLLMLLFVVADLCVRDYDTSDRLVHHQEWHESRAHGLLDYGVMRVLRSFSHWDAVYFTRISLHGYEFEQEQAFFPLLPFLMAVLRNTVLVPLSLVFSPLTLTLLAGVLINVVAFTLAARELFRLGFLVMNDRKLALTAALLFCFTPANAHMVAIYSESLYAFLTFRGLVLLCKGQVWTSAMFLCATSTVRSTGWTYGLFYVCHYWREAMSVPERAGRERTIAILFFRLIAVSVVLISPIVLYNAAAYYAYCATGPNRLLSPWCESTIPNVYSYVQSRYWNVGFLRYYTFNNIPNFALALPILGASFCGVIYYARSITMDDGGRKRGTDSPSGFHGNKTVLPFVLHWIGLLVICVLVLHVQVSTRFLSATPPLYWFAATYFVSGKEERASEGSSFSSFWRKPVWGIPRGRALILAYCIGYSVVGSCLFANFYPWT